MSQYGHGTCCQHARRTVGRPGSHQQLVWHSHRHHQAIGDFNFQRHGAESRNPQFPYPISSISTQFACKYRHSTCQLSHWNYESSYIFTKVIIFVILAPTYVSAWTPASKLLNTTSRCTCVDTQTSCWTGVVAFICDSRNSIHVRYQVYCRASRCHCALCTLLCLWLHNAAACNW